MNSNAPIALFVYNRPEMTRKTVEALQKNLLAGDSELFIFSDGAKNPDSEAVVQQVRDYIRTISGFKRVEIVEQKDNLGLARSIITGVTDIVNRYGRAIVMEDDLVTTPYFLKYMNDGLTMYENEPRVASIHGYIYPVKELLPETFFLRGADCWGWATWKRAWDKFEPDGKKLLAGLESRKLIKGFNFDGTVGYSAMLERHITGENDSWAIRWYASAFLADMLTLYPGQSLVDNIGQGQSGTHKGIAQFRYASLEEREVKVERVPVEEDATARDIIVRYFKSRKPDSISRVVGKLRKLI